jgi:hypothetical protein
MITSTARAADTSRFAGNPPEQMLAFLHRVCESKTSYPSVKAALRGKHNFMTKAPAAQVKRSAGCQPYRCQFCGEFHLGHHTRNVPLEAGR